MSHGSAASLRRVLVVKDEGSDFPPAFIRILTENRYAVESVGSASDVCAAIASFLPELILFPVPDAGEGHLNTLKALRSDNRSGHIPIAVFASALPRDARRALIDAGADILLPSPSDPLELLSLTGILSSLGELETLRSENALLSEKTSVIERAKKEWEKTMDCIDDIVLIVDANDTLLRCNKVFTVLTGMDFASLLSRNWRSLMSEYGFEEKIDSGVREYYHREGKWFLFNSYDTDITGTSVARVLTFKEITDRKRLFDALESEKRQLEEKGVELENAYADLKSVQSRLIQQEKLVSIGYLAAGVAHEINNPLSFITSNLGTLRRYVEKLVAFNKLCEDSLGRVAAHDPSAQEHFAAGKRDLKIDHIMRDLRGVIEESLEGADRVKKIVQDLKGFSRTDEDDFRMADVNAGIESTINIVWNELKYKATLHKEFGEIPLTLCNSSQLNQVVMNLLVNAAQAIKEYGQITVTTWADGGDIYLRVADNGSGIPRNDLPRIFEPFYTTKGAGKGTGLGLSITSDIIKKHQGDIHVESTEGKGTTFTVRIPIRSQ